MGGRWNSTYTMCAVTGSPSSLTSQKYTFVTDDCYDLLAYDGSKLYNLGNLPGLFRTATTFTGFHQISYFDGTAITVGYNNALVKYSGGTFTVLNTGLSNAIGLNGVAWRPNTDFALITGNGGNLFSYHQGELTPIATGTFSDLGGVAWKPNGSYALIAAGTQLLKYSYPTGTITAVVTPVPAEGAIDFDPTGSYALIAQGATNKVLRYTDSDGSVTMLAGPNTPGIGYVFQQVRFSADGAYALITSQSNSKGNLVMWTKSTGAFSNVTGPSSNTANEIAFAPDDTYAFVTTTGGQLLKVTYGQSTYSVLSLTHNRLRGIAWDPPLDKIVVANIPTWPSTSISMLIIPFLVYLFTRKMSFIRKDRPRWTIRPSPSKSTSEKRGALSRNRSRSL
jgi:hypothetical protein